MPYCEHGNISQANSSTMQLPPGSFSNKKREIKTFQKQSDAAIPSKHSSFHSLGEVDFIVTRMSALEEREKKIVKYFKPLKTETQSLLHCDFSVRLPTWKPDEHHRYLSSRRPLVEKSPHAQQLEL